jgi:hypothetical protein
VPAAAGAPGPLAPASELFVTLRNGGQVKAESVAPEGDRVRVTVADGSFTVPRADLVGVVRVPAATGVAEAWLTLTALTERAAPPPPLPPPAPGPSAAGPAQPGPGQGGPAAGAASAGARPADGPAPLRLPYTSSDRPHLVRLATGQVLRVDGFWVEGGELRFRRFGGLIGIALAEVLRLLPEEIAPVGARTPVHFVQQLGPDAMEVRVRGGTRQVRLIGVEGVKDARSEEDPWARIRPGFVLELEFDRERTGPRGEWLAYAFLPNGRMLNGELIRLGLARPRPDGKNVRYLDLFEELQVGVRP